MKKAGNVSAFVCSIMFYNESGQENGCKVRRHNSVILRRYYRMTWSTASAGEETQKKPKNEENTGVIRSGSRAIACIKSFSHILTRFSKDSDSTE